MDLILWRHCDAAPGVPDESRPLTPLGAKQAARVAGWLAPRLPEGCRVVVSPALRAQQTARALGRSFATDPRVAAGASAEAVLGAVNWPDGAPVLVVAHQPTLGQVASLVLDGEADDRAMRAGEVLWLARHGGAPTTIAHALTP